MQIIKLKEKYENIFNIKLTMCEKVIKEILNINDIPSSVYFIVKNLLLKN